MPDDSEEAGPVHAKLLSTLRGIQTGKIHAPKGWCLEVTEVDVKKYSPVEAVNGINGINGTGPSPDMLH
jgi:hypothetical protein